MPIKNYADYSSEDDFDSVNSSFNASLALPGHQNSPKSQSVAAALDLVANPSNITDSILAGVANRLQNFPAHRLDPGEPPVGGVAAVADMANFEDENGTDDAGAMKDAVSQLQRKEWESDDLLFYFQQIEIIMQTAGVKKNFTKFQILVTLLPKKVQDQVKVLREIGEKVFGVMAKSTLDWSDEFSVSFSIDLLIYNHCGKF